MNLRGVETKLAGQVAHQQTSHLATFIRYHTQFLERT
jgi:hypothetical protein